MILIKILFIIIFLRVMKSYKKYWKIRQPSFYSNNDLIRLGHRGMPLESIENTIESFKKSVDSNLDGVELDVQLTLDKKIIVYHNWEIVTESGNVKLIKDLTYSEIKNIPLNSSNKDRIPLLEDVIKVLQKKCIINIEIKSQEYIKTNIESLVIDLIIKYQIITLCIVSSFNPFIIKRIKYINPNIYTAFLWSKKLPQLLFNSPLWVWFCIPDSIHIDIDLLDKNIIKWIRKKGMTIMVFTIVNSKQLEKAKLFNVDGIIIENPNLN